MRFLNNYFAVLLIFMSFYKSNQELFVPNECYQNEFAHTISKQTVYFDKLDRRINLFKPKVINSFSPKLIVLKYKEKEFNSNNRLWLYRPISQRINKWTYFLADILQNCMKIKSWMVHEPFFMIRTLITNLTGYYIYTEYYDDWTVRNQPNYTKSDKNFKDNEFYGLEVRFSPLAIFLVNDNHHAHSGYLFRMINYHTNRNCDVIKSWIKYMIDWLNSTIPLDYNQPFDEKTANNSYQVNYEYNIKKFTCHYLPNDDSPVQLIAYYDINRARISPEGKRDFKETPWKIQNSSWNNLRIRDKQIIKLPKPFGIARRIRLINLKLTDSNIGIQIKLKTRSNEAECDACWGLGHEYPPFETERLLPYTYASVYLNQTICQTILQTKRRPKQLWLEWLLIEPIFGRIRTSSGYAIPMNVLDEWKHVRNIMELEIEIKTPKNQSLHLLIDKIVYELPEHPNDKYYMEKVIYAKRPLPDGTPKFTRACMSSIDDHDTSLTFVILENPKQCIEMDKNFSQVYRKAISPRSPLISYTIRLLNDDYGDKLINTTGYLLIHIELYSFSKDARLINHPDGCNPRSDADGEIMRLAIIEQGKSHVTSYIARWEDRWVVEFENPRIWDIPVPYHYEILTHEPYCNPYKANLDIIYDFSNKTLKALANDMIILPEEKFDDHPMWMGLELYTDPNNENCKGCYASILVDRRNIKSPHKTLYENDHSKINEWHQIHYPRPKNANYMSNVIIELNRISNKNSSLDMDSILSENKHHIPSQNIIKKRVINNFRKLANYLNFSVSVLQAVSYCDPGDYLIYSNPPTCVHCPPGTYSKDITPHESFPTYVCQNCPKGYYQDDFGQTECKKCDRDLTTEKEGSWFVTFCMDLIHVDVNKQLNKYQEPHISKDIDPFRLPQTKVPNLKLKNMKPPFKISSIKTPNIVFSFVCFTLLIGGVLAFFMVSVGFMLIKLNTKMNLITASEISQLERNIKLHITKPNVLLSSESPEETYADEYDYEDEDEESSSDETKTTSRTNNKTNDK